MMVHSILYLRASLRAIETMAYEMAPAVDCYILALPSGFLLCSTFQSILSSIRDPLFKSYPIRLMPVPTMRTKELLIPFMIAYAVCLLL
jgi:hypothetical protein